MPFAASQIFLDTGGVQVIGPSIRMSLRRPRTRRRPPVNFFVQDRTAPLTPWPEAENDDRPLPRGNDDSQLVGLVAKGDVAAFAAIVHRHTPALYRVSCRMLGNRAEAEDVVQECFTRLWTKAARWEARGAGLVAWLHRVTINLCLDRLRRPSTIVTEAFPELVDQSPGPDELLGKEQARLVVERALGNLPERYRAALVLSYYEGFPNLVVAEILEMRIKALESLLHRARRHMRKMLDAQGLSLADFQVSA
jgi:RNA polymerase sigma-70 factor, ECF subfamily